MSTPIAKNKKGRAKRKAPELNEPVTGWVVPPSASGGLDHLGVEAPCIALYGHLLPGITNVTTRARYYSFHPWVVWNFERRYKDHTRDSFARILRRAECLFALVGAHHGLVRDEDERDHGISQVGRDKLATVAADMLDGASAELDDFSRFEGPQRYFKNRLGGLGQYYFGPLRDLRILDYVDGDPNNPPGYDKERGAALAEAFERSVGGADLFFRVLERDHLRRRDLEALEPFCPCGLRSSRNEREQLMDLFFARTETYASADATWRRHSLTLILQLIEESPVPPDLRFENLLRAACYAGTFHDGAEWKLPTQLERVRRAWGTYQRNELLSVALQGFFWATLQAVALDRSGTIRSAREGGVLANALANRALGASALESSVGQLLERTRGSLPPTDRWSEPEHELQRAWRLHERARTKNPGPEDLLYVLNESVAVLLALLARGFDDDPYTALALAPGYFGDEDIHLRSLLGWSKRWTDWKVESWIEWLATSWGITRHLNVALRKLRADSRDTFQIRPLDDELRLVEIPPVVFTSPRLTSTQQILRDLALIESTDDDWWKLTDLGRRTLEACRG